MSDTIHFTCPQCRHTLNLPSSTEGKQGKCPSCNAVATIVPTAEPETSAADELHAANDPPASPQIGETPRDQKGKGNSKGWREKLGDVKSRVTAKADSVANAGKDVLKEKLDATLQEINGLRPLLLESGFIIGDVYLTASITPRIGLVIEQQSDGVNHLEQVLRDRELSQIQKVVMNCIKKIYDLNDVVETHNHTIGQIDIALGVSPLITAHLNSKDSRSFSTASLPETEQNTLTDN